MPRGDAKAPGFTPLREDLSGDDAATLDSTAAEQALLGIILLNNRFYEQVVEIVAAVDFCQPVHGRIFSAIGTLIDRGEIATGITLGPQFDQDAALTVHDGSKYLWRLVS
jgi:replicative DNA helicase